MHWSSVPADTFVSGIGIGRGKMLLEYLYFSLLLFPTLEIDLFMCEKRLGAHIKERSHQEFTLKRRKANVHYLQQWLVDASAWLSL